MDEVSGKVEIPWAAYRASRHRASSDVKRRTRRTNDLRPGLEKLEVHDYLVVQNG